MKIVAINGSPRENGNTYRALEAVLSEIKAEGIETEIIQIGNRGIHGCIGCGHCRATGSGKCVFTTDIANSVIAKISEADGVIIGSPTYFAGMSGSLKCLLDRVFFAGSKGFKYKIGAGVVAVRRAGALPVFEQINKYFSICEMFTAGANYWNMVFGASEGECEKDDEGMQNMRILGKNIAWLTKTVHDSKHEKPVFEEKIKMNFIR